MKDSIFKEIQDLKKQIQHHDQLYYNLDNPEITDFDYDKLFDKLFELENKYPEFKTQDSPTQKMPGKALDKFQKETHNLAMLSLQNSYSKNEITDFYNKISKTLEIEKPLFFLEPKLDGMAIELIYENGILKKALSRGDGQVGENITKNIKTLKGLPISLKNQKHVPKFLELRGEVLIFKKDFEKINCSQKEQGLNLFANPRNLVAGSLRQLDPKITACRPLHLFIHSSGLIKDFPIKTQQEFFEHIEKISLPIFKISKSDQIKAPYDLCRLSSSLEEILKYYDQMCLLRHKLPFEIDGIVIKLNSFTEQKLLGHIRRNPRWAIAGKFPPEEAITQIQDVVFQVGRTGVITPVAKLKALSLGGVLIRQASLHNFQDLARKDLLIGDFVLVHRAGEVIPEIIKALKEKRQGHEKKIQKPEHCPICQGHLKNQGDYLMCSNSDCPAIQQNKLLHFASKKAMNIEYLGEKSLKKFYEWGWLKTFPDLYDLKDKPINQKEGFGGKSHKLLITSLEKSKKTSLAKLLYALGIPLVGEHTSEKISEKIYDLFHQKKQKKLGKIKTLMIWLSKSLLALKKLFKRSKQLTEKTSKKPEKDLNILEVLQIIKNLSQKELEEIPDIGSLVAKSFKSAFENKSLHLDLKKLHKKEIHFVKKKIDNPTLNGLSFVITGVLPKPRSEIKKQIEEKGGQVFGQVGKKINFVLIGKDPGSKAEKAKALGLKTLDWEEFLKFL